MEGVALARKGKFKGRRPMLNEEEAVKLKKMLVDWINKSQIAKNFNMSRQTLYTYISVGK